MKAALYQGIHDIEITNLPDYVCGDDAIVLQNIYSSVCVQMLQCISMDREWDIGLRSVENLDMKRCAECLQLEKM